MITVDSQVLIHSMCACACVQASDQVCVDGVQVTDCPVHLRQRRTGSIAAHGYVVAFGHQHAAMAYVDLR